MKKTLIAGAAALLATPALAQNAPETTDRLQQIQEQIERLQSEVEYLKSNAQGARKEAAQEAVDVSNLKTAVSKYTWSGDLRYRYELIQDEPATNIDASSRQRDRIRLRFGVAAKVNDKINGRIQLSTVNTGDDNPRSTNQTLGEAWSRKSLGIDLAYVDWKAASFANVVLGKQPQPWIRTASYFWDGDLTPEGAAVKLATGPWSAGLYYTWLGERHANDTATASRAAGRTDAKMVGAQLAFRQPVGSVNLLGALGYFDITHVKDEVASATALAGTAASTCNINAAFSGSTNGNTTYDNNGAADSGCSALASDFNMVQALVQADFKLGRFPVTVFADYMKNTKAEVNPVANEKLDTATSFGITFNRAAAAGTWEIGYVYQVSEKDAIWGGFHDSDFNGGLTDGNGSVIKAAYVPATNWTLNGTYFMNTRFIDGVASGSTGRDRDYKRLQLDLNYKF